MQDVLSLGQEVCVKVVSTKSVHLTRRDGHGDKLCQVMLPCSSLHAAMRSLGNCCADDRLSLALNDSLDLSYFAGPTGVQTQALQRVLIREFWLALQAWATRPGLMRKSTLSIVGLPIF